MGVGLIWIVVNCDKASDKLRDNIDHGNFAEANALKYQTDALAEKLKSMLASKAGTLHIATQDRLVLEVPMSIAEDIPNVLEGYSQFFGSLMSVGMGMDFSEASTASLKATHSGEIELFDPADESFKIYKNDSVDGSDDFLEIPPNLFDPLVPKKDEKKNKDKYVAPPGVEQQMQQEAAYLQAMVQQMGGGQPPAPPQQDPNQQQDQEPRDLLEALHGKQIPGREDPDAEEGEGKAPEKKSGKSDEDSEAKDSKASKGKSDDSESDDEDDSDGDGDNEKLANMLGTIKRHIPQLLALKQSDPDGFSDSVKLISRIMGMVKKKS